MNTSEMELPFGNKEELTTEVAQKQATKKIKPIESLSASVSGLDVNSHITPSTAAFFNSINQTNSEKPTQSSSTPEQSIPPSISPEQQSWLVKNSFAPAALAAAMGVGSHIEVQGYRCYLDDLIRESGNPTDPVAIMMLEQLAMGHLFSMRLYSKASEAQGTEATELYILNGLRLSAEFRKLASTFKEYQRK